MARWQSGYAADCNSVNAGSIPTSASILNTCVQARRLIVTLSYTYDVVSEALG